MVGWLRAGNDVCTSTCQLRKSSIVRSHSWHAVNVKCAPPAAPPLPPGAPAEPAAPASSPAAAQRPHPGQWRTPLMAGSNLGQVQDRRLQRGRGRCQARHGFVRSFCRAPPAWAAAQHHLCNSRQPNLLSLVLDACSPYQTRTKALAHHCGISDMYTFRVCCKRLGACTYGIFVAFDLGHVHLQGVP